MNRTLQNLTESATLQIADRVRALEAAGRRIIRLQTGDPDFATHPVVVEEAHRALLAGETHYANTRGLPELRAAIAARLHRRTGVRYDAASEVLVTQGGIHAVMVALQALVNAGDEVLIEDPCWMPYRGCTGLTGGSVSFFEADALNGFRFRVDRLAAALSSRTRVLILNSPCNPTGRVLGPEDLQAVSEIVNRHGLWLISDEVYEALVYGNARHTAAASIPGLRERTITVGSLSKTFAMTGWRVGYAAGPASVIGQMLKASQYSITNVAPFVQRAAIAALTHPAVAAYETEMIQTYAQRREQIRARLRDVPALGDLAPDGAFYFMLRIAASGLDSAAFATRLLEEAAVAVVPGQGFGRVASEHVRVTFATALEDVLEGVERIERMVGSIGVTHA